MCSASADAKLIIQKVEDTLANGHFDECADFLNKEIENRNGSDLVDFLLKSTIFWRTRIENIENNVSDSISRACYLLNEWSKYRDFLAADIAQSPGFDRYLFLFQKTISQIAITPLLQERTDPRADRAQMHLCIARCRRMAGDYEHAIDEYRRVIHRYAQCSAAYAELGDCYLLIGNERMGRLFLREAFYVDPLGVQFDFLESELVIDLIARLRKTEGVMDNWALWFGVYAVLWGVFTVKRDLKTAEYGMLRQRVYALEREYSEKAVVDLEPVILYAYFYLLDYYRKSNEMALNIEEILMKIKRINQNIHTLYMKYFRDLNKEEKAFAREVSFG